MKAIISELWNTGREIITTENEDHETICGFSDFKQFENVVIDKKAKLVMIDNYLVSVAFRKVQHPSGGGSMYICEVEYYI